MTSTAHTWTRAAMPNPFNVPFVDVQATLESRRTRYSARYTPAAPPMTNPITGMAKKPTIAPASPAQVADLLAPVASVAFFGRAIANTNAAMVTAVIATMKPMARGDHPAMNPNTSATNQANPTPGNAGKTVPTNAAPMPNPTNTVMKMFVEVGSIGAG